MTDITECSIPHHVRLVLAIDDLLREVDPVGVGELTSDPHEYSPEIPGLVEMVVTGNISKEALHEEFVRMFYEGMVPNELDTGTILKTLFDLREKWLRWQEPLEGFDQ